MKRTLLLLFLSVGLWSCTTALAVPRAPKKMKAFGSERALRRYLREVAEKQKRAMQRRASVDGELSASVTVTSSAGNEESITNTQHAGVDEGGIVKLHGDHLVMLRRGRLFTVAIGDGALRPVSAVDAFGPDVYADHNWYDEMLVSGDTVIVIGYSYSRQATEVGLFDIDAQGQLSYRSTYHLRSNDYYSSRNYASRLIGTKLIFYTPLHFYRWSDEDPLASLPAVRKWHKDAKPSEFRRIVSANRVYRPAMDFEVEDGITLHTVTICDLANRGFNCQATSVVGPAGNVFYVSPDSIYVWATPWSESETQSPSLLFRMPLDGSDPGALRVSGSPVDQFSFLESEDRHLNVLVRSEGHGDGMWNAEVAEGDVAFMRVPLSSFSDGSTIVPATSYRQLPKPSGYYFENRFVGDYLIYGSGYNWGEHSSAPRDLYLLEWARGALHKFNLPYGVDRIEQMGTGAVVIGTDGKDLHFTSVRLEPRPELVSRYTREAASEGDMRSHGFFYKPDGEDSGTLGLPIRKPLQPGSLDLFETSAALLFLRTDAFEFQMLGELEAQSEKAQDDKCRASCIDWYGNARPLFLRGRVFALLGYELVEGRLDQGRMVELRRVNYAPQIAQR